VASGSLDVVEAGKLIDESWGELTGAAAELGMAGGLAIRALVDAMRAAGVESEAVSATIMEAVGQISAASTAIVDSGTESLAGLRLAGAGLLATWQELRAEGTPIAEVVDSIGASAKNLKQQFLDLGAEAPAGLGKLIQFTNLLGKEGIPELVDQATAFGEVFQGLADIGLADQAVFDDFGQSLEDTFASLQAGGASSAQALALMQPQLQTLLDAQADLGFAVDAGTQSLLDQAVAQGVVKGATLDTTGAVTAGFDGLFQRFDALLTAQGVATEGMFTFGASASTSLAGISAAAQVSSDTITESMGASAASVQTSYETALAAVETAQQNLTAATSQEEKARADMAFQAASDTAASWAQKLAEMEAGSASTSMAFGNQWSSAAGTISTTLSDAADASGTSLQRIVDESGRAARAASDEWDANFRDPMVGNSIIPDTVDETNALLGTIPDAAELAAKASAAAFAGMGAGMGIEAQIRAVHAQLKSATDPADRKRLDMLLDQLMAQGGFDFGSFNFGGGFATALGETRTIPGPPGRPRLIMAHTGETIGQPRGYPGGNTYNLNIAGETEEQIMAQIRKMLRQATRGIAARR
jgi:hypothetical protein